LSNAVLGVWRATYTEFKKNIGLSLMLPMHICDFRHVAPFRNKAALKAIRVENLGCCSLSLDSVVRSF